ncbi:MAG TPA: glycosyltransferase family 39 protein [Anaeromyxobacteraceae bacterium]|nr:glycosyltransferase family 39 protein [Anaeromyxobacteraceae bacterium]
MNDRPPSLRAVWAVAALAALLRALAFGGLELYTDESYYWLWSQRPALGYYDHPPMVAWLIWLSRQAVPGELGVRLLFLACGGLAVSFAGLAARELSDHPRAPLWAALLAASAPLLTITGALALPDAPVEAAYAAGTWLLARARGRRWAWAGAAVGLALLSKFTAALLAPALLLLVAWDRELRQELRTPWPWLGAGVALALFAPCLAWNAAHDWVAIRFQLWHGFRGGGSLTGFLLYLGALLAGAGPVALALGATALARARTSPERRVAAATLLPLAVTLYSAMRGPVEANWGALTFPGLAAAAGAGLTRLRPALARGLVAGSVAVSVAVAGLYAAEIRRPRLIPPAAPVVERFRGQADFAREARAAAARACSSLGSPAGCDPADPFVFTSTYQVASQLAFYAGWRRFGPAQARPSQLDLWGEAPPAGTAFLFVGPGDPPEAPARLFRAEGEGQPVTFQVQVEGQVVRTGGVTAFARFLGPRFRPLPP